MIKLKIERNEMVKGGQHYTFYNTYCGFVGMPSTLPFITKWVLDKVALTEKELSQYVMNYVTTLGKIKIVTTIKRG